MGSGYWQNGGLKTLQYSRLSFINPDQFDLIPYPFNWIVLNLIHIGVFSTHSWFFLQRFKGQQLWAPKPLTFTNYLLATTLIYPTTFVLSSFHLILPPVHLRHYKTSVGVSLAWEFPWKVADCQVRKTHSRHEEGGTRSSKEQLQWKD